MLNPIESIVDSVQTVTNIADNIIVDQTIHVIGSFESLHHVVNVNLTIWKIQSELIVMPVFVGVCVCVKCDATLFFFINI